MSVQRLLRQHGLRPRQRLGQRFLADEEVLERIVAAGMKTHRSEYMGADGDEAILWAMLMGYEMTGEAKYLERLKGYAALQVDFAKTHGGIPAAKAFVTRALICRNCASRAGWSPPASVLRVPCRL